MKLIMQNSKIPLLAILFLLFSFAQDLNQAQLLEQGGQFETAFKLYQHELLKNPDQAAALNGLIRTARELNRYDSLLNILQEIKPRARKGDLIEEGIIEALFGLRRRSEAISRLELLLRSRPDRLIPVVDLLTRVKEFQLAIRYLEPAVNRSFSYELAPRLINLYESTGKLPQACALIARIANNSDDNNVARYLQQFLPHLRTWGKQSGVNQLIAELEKIKNPILRTQTQTQVLLGAGRETDAARLLLNRAQSREISEPELFQFARDCELNRYYSAALAIYQFLGLAPDIARVLRRQGKIAAALAILKSDTSPAAIFEYAEIARLEQNDFARAAAAYSRFLKMRPDDPNGLYGLAAALVGLKQIDSARNILNRIDPPDDRTTYLKAKSFLYQNKFDSLSITISEFSRRFPESPLFNDILELGILTLLNQKLNLFAQIMLHLDAGDYEIAMRQADSLATEDALVAQQALLLKSEIFLRERQYLRATAVLESLFVRFPQGELTPAALFRQAEIYREILHDSQKFRRTAEQLIENFPGYPLAPVIRTQLLTDNQIPTAPLR